MNVSLYQAAAAMNAQARWQELISQNLASGYVPGFRKQEVSFSAVQAGLDPTTPNLSGLRYVIPSASVTTNFQAGEIRATDHSMDFAIDGPGFFEVQLPNGSAAYTRDGEFHLNAQGQLVNKQGYVVLGEGGPVQVDPNNAIQLTVSPTGEVSQGDQIKGKLRLVEFNQPQSLTAIGQGYFLADQPGVLPAAATASSNRAWAAANCSRVLSRSSLTSSSRLTGIVWSTSTNCR